MDNDLAYLEGLARESLSFPTQDGEPVVISYDTSSIASRFLDVTGLACDITEGMVIDDLKDSETGEWC